MQLMADATTNIYRPPTKLREGNVFTNICLFTEGGGEYPWVHVHGGGWVPWGKYSVWLSTESGYLGVLTPRAFISTRPLIHKHVKISVDKWILETTHPHKHAQTRHNCFPKKFYFRSLNISNSITDIS